MPRGILAFALVAIVAAGDVAKCQADSHEDCEGPTSDHAAEISLLQARVKMQGPGDEGGDEGGGDEGGDQSAKIGGCIYKASDGAVPPNPYTVRASTSSSFGAGFGKEKDVYGLKLLYNKGSHVMDEGYICHISNLIMHLLSPSPCNQPKQKEVVEMMWKKKCNTPVYWKAAGNVLDKGSSCDIMTVQTEQTELQHFEILEHALHAINTCGYAPVIPEWSFLDEKGKAWLGVQEMRKKSLWDTSDYTKAEAGIPALAGEELRRVLLMEYHWLLVRTMSGFFGGNYPDNPKWTLKTPTQLQKQHPIGYELYMTTIAPLIAQVSHTEMTSLKNNLMRGGTLGACTESDVPLHGSKNTCAGGPSVVPAPAPPPATEAPAPAPAADDDADGDDADGHDADGDHSDDHDDSGDGADDNGW